MESKGTHFAHRESSGLVVDLYWDPADLKHEFHVRVADRGSGFVLYPTSSRAAIEAFHHPFASGLSAPSSTIVSTNWTAKSQPRRAFGDGGGPGTLAT